STLRGHRGRSSRATARLPRIFRKLAASPYGRLLGFRDSPTPLSFVGPSRTRCSMSQTPSPCLSGVRRFAVSCRCWLETMARPRHSEMDELSERTVGETDALHRME